MWSRRRLRLRVRGPFVIMSSMTVGPDSADLRGRCVASGCADVMARTLDARGVIIHHYDPRMRELRIIGADGPNTEELLGSVANADDDFVAINVLATRIHEI